MNNLLRFFVLLACEQLVTCPNDNKFHPKIKKLKGLTCYQCEANSTVKTSDCHTSMFRASSKEVKLEMLIQCPQESVYCLKKISNFADGSWLTQRACAPRFDDHGQSVRVGCMVQNSTEVCLCRVNLCNKQNVCVVNGGLLVTLLFFAFL